MVIAFIGDRKVNKEVIKKIFKEDGASSLMLFPSGDLEDTALDVAGELGLKTNYDSYASGSYIGGVKTLIKNIKKTGGKLYIAANPRDCSPKVETILAEVDKHKINFQFI